ncbi:MAG TPA: hypothetical protein VLT91_02390 [Rhizomicrobium sp.]|nr:hypothetical protein [Rhizomicrobium sp.]
MRSLLIAATIAAGLATAAQAQNPPASTGSICLRSQDISNTTTPDDKTILFHMRGGKVWRNDLRGTCSGLRFHGFIYTATPPDQICGNLQIIRVLRTHAVCSLGPFTEVTKAPADNPM